MTDHHIILISGKQGSGKSALCTALIEELAASGYQVYRTRFAKALYEMHDAVLEVARRYGIMTKEKDGDLLQLIGTDWGRMCIGQDVWVNAVRNLYNEEIAKAKGPFVFIVEDLRFQNEFDAFPSGFKIRLTASRKVRKERVSYWRENDTHPSEIDLDDHETAGRFDLVIDTQVNSKEATIAIALAYLRNKGMCAA